MAKTTSKRNMVLVLETVGGEPVYLGELDPGVRQGVRKLENAVRFTALGSARVRKDYPGSSAVELSNAQLEQLER